MLMNIYHLLPLCDNVAQLGLLWTHSCFSFEEKNRFLLKTIHGSQKIECQLQSAVNMMHSIPEIIHEKISKNEILMKFYTNMNKYKYNSSQLGSNETKISENIYVLGVINPVKLDITLYSMLTTYFGVPPSATIQEFYRTKASKEIFHAKSYRRVSKRDSTVVYVKVMNGDMKFGSIKCFLKYIVEENEYYLAWLKVFRILHIDKNSHIVTADSNEKTYTDELVPMKNILTKVINVFFDQANANYLCFLPNYFET